MKKGTRTREARCVPRPVSKDIPKTAKTDMERSPGKDIAGCQSKLTRRISALRANAGQVEGPRMLENLCTVLFGIGDAHKLEQPLTHCAMVMTRCAMAPVTYGLLGARLGPQARPHAT